MVEFIQVYWASILVIVLFIAGLILLYKAGKKELVRNIVLALVVKAEKALGSGTGELKYALVIEAIYDKLPAILRILFTKKEIDELIEDAVSKLKDILSDGITLIGYDDELYIDTLNNDGK